MQQESADIFVIGERLKAERERLGYTQTAFAEIAGAGRRTLIDWERGVSSPTAVQLSALAAVGLNVQLVVTGQPGQIGSAGSAERFDAVLVEQAIKEVVDLFSLEPAVNAKQFATAVVKLCRKAAPSVHESTEPVVHRYEGSQQNFYGSVGGDVGGRDIVKGPRK